MLLVPILLSPGFESLAPEILLSIIKQLPDLVSVDCVLRASPSSFRLFETYGPEVIDAVISRGHIHGHIRAMIRISALIRTSRLAMNSLTEFKNRFTLAAMEERVRCLKKSLPPLELEANTPVSVLRGILATNRHITCLSLELLDDYLERFMALKPRHLINEKKCPSELHAPRKLSQGYQMKDVTTQDIGPPSWDEEQRVIRVFWRIQILYDLKRAGANGLLKWSLKDLNTLEEMPLPQLYGLGTVMHSHGRTTADAEFYEMTSVEEYLRESYSIANLTSISNYSWLKPPSPPAEVRRTSPAPIPNPQWYDPKLHDWVCNTSASTGVWFYFHQFCWSIKQDVLFPVFGRLGFAFWNPTRLQKYGLIPAVLGELENRAYTYRWLSVIDDELISRPDMASR